MRTILLENQTEMEVKKSRFIGLVCPVGSQAEAERVLAGSRTRWPGATHYCFAWILHKPISERCGDDGEPSGTAGLPILTVLRNYQVEDIVAVAVRYYGGILLGSSGLIRAYSETIRDALSTAEIVQYQPGLHIKTTVEYTELGMIQHYLPELPGVEIQGIDYSSHVTLNITLPLQHYKTFQKKLGDLTNGRGIIEVLGECKVKA